jgi:F-type H+-transporting ATPase subunit delta
MAQATWRRGHEAPERSGTTVTNRTAATRYARALLEVAQHERVDLDLIEGQLAGFARLVSEHDGLRKALLSPTVPSPRKRAAVADLIAHAGIQPIVGRTLLLLAERDRLAILPDVADVFRDRVLDTRNIVRAEVTTAAPLPPGRLHDIQRSLAAATGRTIDLTSRVDPSIVGGIVARIGSTVFDASITNHLQRIRQRLDPSI